MCRAFWGFCLKHQGKNIDSLDLELYRDADLFIHFISYIKERGVQHQHILKHISLARKVLSFLQSGSALDSEVRDFTSQMDSWLNLLSRQVAVSAPTQVSDTLPAYSAVQCWVLYKVRRALDVIEEDMSAIGSMTARCALMVQDALIASLVCGSFFPPIRLSVIKSLTHPSYKTCFDPDCLQGSSCRGNHILLERLKNREDSDHTWHFGYGPRLRITLKIAHQKNDRYE